MSLVHGKYIDNKSVKTCPYEQHLSYFTLDARDETESIQKNLKISLTSSNLLTVSLHCGICVTKFDVVGLLKSSRVSRRKSLTEITPGISAVFAITTLCATSYLTSLFPFKLISRSYVILA